VIGKAVCGDRNLVYVALPLPDQPCSSPKSLASITLPFGAQSEINFLEFCSHFRVQTAISQFLNAEGKDREYEFAAKTWRCWSPKTPVPEIKQANLGKRW
jgi:hypothetical protein